MLKIGIYFGQKQRSFQKYPLFPFPSEPPSSFGDALSAAIKNNNEFGNEITYFWSAPFWTLAFHLSHALNATTASLFDWHHAGVRPDIIIVVDLPRCKKDFDELLDSHPCSRFILVVAESPLERHHQHDPRNYAPFSAVITYNKAVRRADAALYYYNLPFSFCRPQVFSSGLANLLKRKNFCAFIGGAHATGWRRNFQYTLGAKGLPILWQYLTGWRIPPSSAMLDEIFNGYRQRRNFLKASFSNQSTRISIYGSGWNDAGYAGWTARLRSYRKCVLPAHPIGLSLGSKFSLLSSYNFYLACENYTGNKYYVSEKIFDAMAAGCIPLYIGSPSSLPEKLKNCVIDLSRGMPSFSCDWNNSVLNTLTSLQEMSAEEIYTRRSECLGYMRDHFPATYGHKQFHDAVELAIRDILA